EDMVNWTDHGRVLSVDDVDWAISHAWAIDAAYWKGNYYLVFCMRERQNSNIFRLGLAISHRPEGPFKSIGMIRGPEGMDPSLFIDEDHQPYIIYANARKCYVAKLTDDLMTVVPGSTVDVTAGLPQLQEGPWVHKYNDKYYLSYPGLQNDQWPEVMYVSVADKITGPYKPQNQYIPYFEGQAGSNHGSIVKFKGKWIAFYHAAILSEGNGYNRNLMADFLTYNPDGTIKPITPAKEGITGGKKVVCRIQMEAENGKAAGGNLDGTYVDNIEPGFSGNGYATGFNDPEESVEVLAQLAFAKKYILEVCYASDSNRKIAVSVNDFMLNGDYAAWKDIQLPKTKIFSTVKLDTVLLKPGDNRIKLKSLNGDLKIDYFLLKPVQ
ncbi:MAG TPA: family 43 glycosylhydrolase, partial [Bacteroidales bacterium]|nr:family 43 glycosylhydrolase [Bacteroidales bacterium]